MRQAIEELEGAAESEGEVGHETKQKRMGWDGDSLVEPTVDCSLPLGGCRNA